MADTPEFTIRVNKNGSYVVTGCTKLVNSKGEELETRERFTLCRCGHSQEKPFCDGSHKSSGFEDERN